MGRSKNSWFAKPLGRPVGPKGENLYYCEDCDKLFRAEDAKPMHHSWSRHGDGEEFHPYVCPDCNCTLYVPRGDSIAFEPTQENLEKHCYHDVEIVRRTKKGPLTLACKTCGNIVTQTIKESEISKPKKL